MLAYPCIVCGRLTAQTRCSEHRGNTSWNKARARAPQQAFRLAVLERDGWRCTYLSIDGTRCPATRDLHAAHIVSLERGGSNDPSNGITLCRAHHRRVDHHAR